MVSTPAASGNIKSRTVKSFMLGSKSQVTPGQSVGMMWGRKKVAVPPAGQSCPRALQLSSLGVSALHVSAEGCEGEWGCLDLFIVWVF